MLLCYSSIGTFVLVLLTIGLIGIVSGKRSRGRIYGDEDFVYLERFCFISEIGNLYFELSYPMFLHDDGVESLLMYYDTASQWSSAYKVNKSCPDRVGILDPDNNQQIRLSPYSTGPEFDRTTTCKVDTRRDGEKWVNCIGNRRFISQRARWWFLAISNCDNGSSPVFMDYDITMTNGDPADIWFYQFSADEFYILPVDIGFLVIEMCTLVVACVIAHNLRSRHMLHQTFKLFVQSIVLEVCSLSCMVCAYGKYAQDGVGLPFLKLLGQLFRAACTTSFILLLLLIAKGYTITRGRLSTMASWKLTILICLYLIFYMAMFIWQIKIFDPAIVTFVSESIPGYGIQVLRLLSWVSYVLSSFFTSKKYPKKREFYIVLGIFMTLWFWMGPATLYMANYLLDNWVREEVVNAVENAVVFYGFLVFTFLTWPSNSNKNFPFHVRTTQIGDMSEPSDFPQNAYEMESREEPNKNEQPSEPDDELTY